MLFSDDEDALAALDAGDAAALEETAIGRSLLAALDQFWVNHAEECKGARAVVVGKGEIDHWTGRDGVERAPRKIVAEGVGPDLRFVDVELQRSDRGGATRPRLDEGLL